ncbi:MAG: PQQ-binding-like beta-propeller repeat protein [Bryobacteraceae bacterium]
MGSRLAVLAGVFLATLAYGPCALGEDWPEFRGPSGQGVSAETDLPLAWSPTENVAWKTPVPGRGWSSPSIAHDRVWLTTAVPVPDADPGARSLRLMAFDRETGAQTLDLEVFRLDDAGKQHQKNSFASPTPLVEDDRVYVHFGKLGTAAVTTAGEILWKRQFEYAYQHGSGGSPVLYKNLLLFSCDGTDVQFVVALDKTTGETVWKKDRPRPGTMAFTTPLLIDVDGKAQLISPSAFRTVAYDPATGEELWQVRYGKGFSNVPRPVFAHGLVYLCTGFYEPELLAVKPDGAGDVTDTHVVWRYGRGVPLTPSPLVVGDEIYIVSDNGILTCLDAKTGEVRYKERLGGNFSASPVLAAGRIYFQSEEGETIVIAPGPQFQRLGGSAMDEATLASLAPSNGSIFLRTAGHLYRLRTAPE